MKNRLLPSASLSLLLSTVALRSQVDWKEMEVEYSHHGPIVAHKKDKAYAMAIPYAEELGLTDQMYKTMTARNLGGIRQALGGYSVTGRILTLPP